MTEKQTLIGLVGGTGFIGRAVSRELDARGHKVRLIARHRPNSLKAGEEFTMADIKDPQSLSHALAGCDVAVNLVAILAERGSSFEEIIHQGTWRIATAAKAVGVKHFVLVSALGAHVSSPSAYARAKAYAENAARELYPDATILRPSLVMGQGGGFVKQIELLTRLSPFMILPGHGLTRFQPITLQALVKELTDSCQKATMRGVTLDAVGPDIVTFRQLAKQELLRLKRRRIMVPLPWSLTRLVALAMSNLDRITNYRLIPEWLLVTPDQVKLLEKDNIAEASKL